MALKKIELKFILPKWDESGFQPILILVINT